MQGPLKLLPDPLWPLANSRVAEHGYKWLKGLPLTGTFPKAPSRSTRIEQTTPEPVFIRHFNEKFTFMYGNEDEHALL